MMPYNYRWKRDWREFSQLVEMLPAGGVERHFKAEIHRRQRVIDVRWPTQVECPICSSHHGWWFQEFDLWECQMCKHQLSPTSGTQLHGSHLELRFWFRAAELVIRRSGSGIPTIQDLSDQLGVHYRSASRVRKIVVEDVEAHGFLTRAVCVS